MSVIEKTKQTKGRANAGVTKRSSVPLIPAIPQVNLLPAEIAQGRSLRKVKRYLLYALVGVILAIVLAAVGLNLLHQQAEADLRAEQGRTDDLLLEQRKYMPVTVVQERLSLTEDALDYVSRTDIEWADLLSYVSGATPDEVRISSFTAAANSPLAISAITDAPLYPLNVGTLTLEGTADTRPDATAWTRGLLKIPGVANARIDVAAVEDLDAEEEYFNIKVTVLLDPSAQRADGQIANLAVDEEQS